MNGSDSSSNCSDAACGCGSTPATPVAPTSRGLARRDFLNVLGVGATAMVLRPWQTAMAGPFTRADFEKLVPADKKLSPEWIKSLTARGERTRYRGRDLVNIGMPIGGLCAGQLYLGGDGRLWRWDIFNGQGKTGPEHYAQPMKPASPVDQGFALRVRTGDRTQMRTLDSAQWRDVSFIGEYPIGYVNYADPDCPVTVSLEAFSPFIPLNADDSSLPATVLEFTLRNTSPAEVTGDFGGWLQNAVCLHTAPKHEGWRRNRVALGDGLIFMEGSAEDAPAAATVTRPDIVFEDFEQETYGDWTATGTAFGTGPVEAARMPDYQGDVSAKGKRLVNSHASAPGRDVSEKDDATGRLTSRSFVIERHYINFLIGGGNHKWRTCLNLLVDNAVVLSATGANRNQLQPMNWDVRPWAGKTAQLVIVDEQAGGWGNIGVDDIRFSDQPREPVGPLAAKADYGTMGLAWLNAPADALVNISLPDDGVPAEIFSPAHPGAADVKKPFPQKLVGSLAGRFKLAPGETATVTFALTWYFPNLKLNRLPPGRSYGAKFNSAFAVATYLAKNFGRLAAQTRRWHDTWYDSTLPYWLLDRTFLNTSILATSTCYQFGNGRFYSWEGVGCCEGTCGHVWHYAHAMARVFPELERSLRAQVDFGLAQQPDGAIHFRGELNNIPAVDAQAGTIPALREHQISADAAFLRANWRRIKQAAEWLIARDESGDGLLEGGQHNTLDTDWYGPVAWLSGLYLAALLAAAAMADEMDDPGFAAQCRKIFTVGQKNLVSQLFDQDYFVNKVNAKHLDAINSGTGCEIDQVMGQSWAFQVGLPRVLPPQETLASLRSLWRYNFTPDVGPYRDAYKAGRWYAMPGEAGLLMCTFPRTDWDYAHAKGKGPDWAAGYFNECMSGFEYQVAGHMIWEGLVTEGLAITRAVHDRYHASRRNPWNEIECGDHYVRSMASYGVFTAVCGYEYHGPKGHLGFAPRVTPENFKAPFTAAEGWGSYRQQRTATSQSHVVELKHGRLQLKSFAVELWSDRNPSSVNARVNGRPVPHTLAQNGRRLQVHFRDQLILDPNASLEVLVAMA